MRQLDSERALSVWETENTQQTGKRQLVFPNTLGEGGLRIIFWGDQQVLPMAPWCLIFIMGIQQPLPQALHSQISTDNKASVEFLTPPEII